MTVTFDQKRMELVVHRDGEKRINKESTFYYELAKECKKNFGWDCIRKEMAKDGHMVDDGRFYLVDRKRRFCFYQTDWATYDLCRDYYNSNVEVRLPASDLRKEPRTPLLSLLKTSKEITQAR